MEEKQIRKWLRRRFSPLGWALVVYLTMMNLLVVVAIMGDVVRAAVSQEGLDSLDLSSMMGNGWGYLAAIGSGLAIAYGWKGPEFFAGELIARSRPMKAGTFGAMLLLCLGAQTVNLVWVTLLEAVMNLFGRSVIELADQVSGAADTVSMFLYASILGPMAEELLFRGICLRTLEPFGKRFAILGSAVLFGLFHGNLLQAPYAFMMGLVMGYLAVEYSIFWALAMHLFNNLVLANGLTILMQRLPVAVQDGIDWVLFGGGTIAALAILILRRREIREYRAQGMDRRCIRCFFTSGGVVVFMAAMLISMIITL